MLGRLVIGRHRARPVAACALSSGPPTTSSSSVPASAGLSAAMRLAGAGRAVTLLEREARARRPGRAVVLPATGGGTTFDTGPTVLTMPDLIADCFGARRRGAGRLARPSTRWTRLYRARFADGSSRSTCTPTSTRWPTEIAARVRAGRGRRLPPLRRRSCRSSTGWRCATSSTATSTRRSTWWRPSLARLAAIGGFRRLAPKVARVPRRRAAAEGLLVPGHVRRAVALRRARDLRRHRLHGLGRGRVLPARRDARACPRAMAGAAEKHGVEFRVRRDGERGRAGGATRAVAVLTPTASGSPCDAVVLNPDLPVPRELLGPSRGGRAADLLPVVLSCCSPGSTGAYPATAHHTISFGRAWREVFDELLGGPADERPVVPRRRLPSRRTRRSHPRGAARRTSCSPPPTSTPADRLGPDARPRTASTCCGTLEAARLDRASATRIEVEARDDPAGLGRPRAWSAARRSRRRTRSARPGRSGRATCGARTSCSPAPAREPGVGVPMVLVRGRLAAERMTGTDPAYRSEPGDEGARRAAGPGLRALPPHPRRARRAPTTWPRGCCRAPGARTCGRSTRFARVRRRARRRPRRPDPDALVTWSRRR